MAPRLLVCVSDTSVVQKLDCPGVAALSSKEIDRHATINEHDFCWSSVARHQRIWRPNVPIATATMIRVIVTVKSAARQARAGSSTQPGGAASAMPREWMRGARTSKVAEGRSILIHRDGKLPPTAPRIRCLGLLRLRPDPVHTTLPQQGVASRPRGRRPPETRPKYGGRSPEVKGT